MKFVNLALLLIFICNSMQRTAIDLDKFNDPVKDEMDSVEESRMVKQKIRELFDKYDSDKNEKISVQSYKELLHEFFNWIEQQHKGIDILDEEAQLMKFVVDHYLKKSIRNHRQNFVTYQQVFKQVFEGEFQIAIADDFAHDGQIKQSSLIDLTDEEQQIFDSRHEL